MNDPLASRPSLQTWLFGSTLDEVVRSSAEALAEVVPEKLGRYRLGRLIGSGGMGRVYEATSEGSREPVALKTLLKLSPGALLGLKREFRRTAALSHPNLVELYELVQDAGIWFFSMELVRGRQLLYHLWDTTAYPGAERACGAVMRVLPQLLDALGALHENNILHLDFKPSNVLVTDAGVVKLLDFGLSEIEDTAANSNLAAYFAGTPGYMAPEQMWGTRSRASDCYALGATLYEAVTGRLPFSGALTSTLQAKRTLPAPSVSDSAPGVPESLAHLIDGLLSREPAQRPDIDAARRELGFGSKARWSGVRGPSRGVRLFGRESELQQLLDLLPSVSSASVLCHLVGDSGVGKSSVLQSTCDTWRARGALVLTSRCFEWQTIPFKAADALVDQLYDALGGELCEAKLPSDLALASRMFPVLEGLPFEVIPARPPDVQLERTRAIAALAEVVSGLAESRPVVFCIDDAQWGDKESAELLGQLVAAVPRGSLLALCQRPPGERTFDFPGHLAAQSGACQVSRIELASLGRDDSVAMARSVAGDNVWSDEQLRSIAEDAGGVPIFIERVARFGAAGNRRPPTMTEVLQAHYAELTADARALLDMIVIAQHPTALRHILAALGGVSQVHGALAALQAGCLIRCEGLEDSALLEPYHDRIRQVTLAALAFDKQRELHRALATELESIAGNPGWVAEHWHLAGEDDRAAKSAVDAAERAYEALAFERASDLYSQAIKWDARLSRKRPEVLVRHAWALYHAGRCARAGALFARAADSASQDERLLLQGHAVEALLVAGQVSQGNQVLRSLLTALSIRPVMRPPWRLIQLLLLIVQVRFALGRVKLGGRVDMLARSNANVTWNAGKALTNVLPIDGIVLLLRSLLFSMRSRDPVAVARGLCIAASGYVPFLEDRAPDALREAERIAEHEGDPYLPGLVSVIRSTAAHMSGEWLAVVDETDRARPLLEQATVPTNWELSLLQGNRTAGLEQLGDLIEMAAFSRRAAREALRRGDLVAYVSTLSAYGFTRAAANDSSGLSETTSELSRVMKSWSVGYGVWHCTLWRLEVLQAVRDGDYGAARVLVDTAWPLITDAMLLRLRALRCLVLDTRVAVELWGLARREPGRDRRLRVVRRLIRDMASTDRLDAAPNAEAWRGHLACCLDDKQAAIMHLERAVVLYEQVGMKERQCLAAWRLAKLRGDGEEQQRQVRLAGELGVVDVDGWARFRAPTSDTP
jgi:serine/threonine protein kinase